MSITASRTRLVKHAGRTVILAALIAATFTHAGCAAPRQSPGSIRTAYKFARLKPVEMSETAITGGYLLPYIQRSMDRGVLDYLDKFEAHGFIENFRIVAGKQDKKHSGWANCNEFVYKLVEAGGYYAPRSEKIAKAFAKTNADILSAQCQDGYLNTYYENPLIKKKNPNNRFLPNNRFEFYNFGHFTQAAIAWYRTTGDRTMLDAAIRFADLICEKFSAPKMMPYTRNRGNRPNLKYEHPDHEMALVELYRVTGDRKYLELAKHTLDQYGFWEFEEIWGHAVQETLLLCGGADVYMEYGRADMLAQLEKMWRDVHERKMYITGGVGSGGPGESYGKAFELPNARSYCETCAALSLVLWNHRMLLATGDVKYADYMDRCFYNATLVGISLSGTEYFYSNRMETKKGAARKPWHGCPCCPPNIHRLLGSMQRHIYTTDDSGVQINMYNSSTLKTRVGSQNVELVQDSDYPRSGDVEITVRSVGKFALSLRIPAWADGAEAVCNGQSIGPARAGTRLKIDRKWNPGDVVKLTLPMKVRLVAGNAKVPDQLGKIAIFRGPLVYCLEGADNPNVDLFAVTLPGDAKFAESPDKALGGIVRLTCDGIDRDGKRVKLNAIPYNVWANRGLSAMRIWIPRRAD